MIRTRIAMQLFKLSPLVAQTNKLRFIARDKLQGITAAELALSLFHLSLKPIWNCEQYIVHSVHR
jgi:hypothetical protein